MDFDDSSAEQELPDATAAPSSSSNDGAANVPVVDPLVAAAGENDGAAIEPAKSPIEHQAAKVYLRYFFQDAQAELYDQAAKDLATKKYHTASTAAPVQSANFHSKFTNPYLSAP